MKKKIVYIVGCGRSGSTLMGFCLGNAVKTLDLGEVIDFARFQGKPNSFDVGTPNYAYWQGVLHGLEKKLGPIDFDSLMRMQTRVDYHTSFLPMLLIGSRYRKKDYLPYQDYVKGLYEVILDDEEHEVFVSSSKYPSRLLHLLRAFPDQHVYVIHLIRNPIELAKAFRNSEQGKTKTFLQTMFYFFTINIFSILATRTLAADRFLRVHYEDFASEPEKELKRIGAAFGIDTTPAINKISQGLPLERGYIFNGNRMRINSEVVFRKRPRKTEKRSFVEAVFEKLACVFFGGTTAKESSSSNS